MNLQLKIEELLISQKKNWAIAKKNFNALELIQSKIFDFNGYKIKAQYNPSRAISSLAKIDKETINKRACFLCKKNRPKEQESINFIDKYDILINPYPIFQKHFTIPYKDHCEQKLSQDKLNDMLNLSKELPNYTIFFNGAKSGASAPDHFHFQAGNIDFFPQPVYTNANGIISKYVIKSNNKEEISNWINKFSYITKNGDFMNLFCQYSYDNWILTLFPRKAHRPTQYFSGELMVSPGAVDMAGVLIITREEDYNKINEIYIKNIFNQVSLF